MRRKYANAAEEAFCRLAERNGWRVSKRGWPDFLCWGPNGEIIAVEVKPRRVQSGRMVMLKREQAEALDFLTSKGIRCFVSDGVTLEPYDREKHAPESRRRTVVTTEREEVGA